jgi:hypothetical protein
LCNWSSAEEGAAAAAAAVAAREEALAEAAAVAAAKPKGRPVGRPKSTKPKAKPKAKRKPRAVGCPKSDFCGVSDTDSQLAGILQSLGGAKPATGATTTNRISGSGPSRKRKRRVNGPNKPRTNVPLPKRRPPAKSGFYGVSPSSSGHKWVAQLCYDGKNRRLGSFYTKEEAAVVYDKAVREHRGTCGRARAICNYATAEEGEAAAAAAVREWEQQLPVDKKRRLTSAGNCKLQSEATTRVAL